MGFPACLGCSCSRISSPTCSSEAEPGAWNGKVVTAGSVPALKMSGASAVTTSPASPNTQRIVKFKRPVYMWIFLIQVFIARFSLPERKATIFHPPRINRVDSEGAFCKAVLVRRKRFMRRLQISFGALFVFGAVLAVGQPPEKAVIGYIYSPNRP